MSRITDERLKPRSKSAIADDEYRRRDRVNRLGEQLVYDIVREATTRVLNGGGSQLDEFIVVQLDNDMVRELTWQGPARERLLARRAELRAKHAPIAVPDTIVRPPLQEPPPSASTPDWLLEAQAAAE